MKSEQGELFPSKSGPATCGPREAAERAFYEEIARDSTCSADALMPSCYHPDPPPEIWAYSGFARNFTNHQYCERTCVGLLLKDGTIKPCDCCARGHRE